MGEGYPDLDITWQGLCLKAELKYIEKGNKLLIRPTQKNWHKKETKAGGKCCFLVGWQGKIWGFAVKDLVSTDIREIKNKVSLDTLEKIKHFFVNL